MATPAEILREMTENVESQSENLASSISQVEAQIDDLEEQIDGIQNGLCGVAESDLIAYLDGTKIPELEIIYGSAPHTVSYGGTFGTIGYGTGNITDWIILDSTGNPVFEYLGTNWDGDAIITQYITDYSFGNDYLTRPLTSGATYGLIPRRDNLDIALAILEENKVKVDASEDIMDRYAV